MGKIGYYAIIPANVRYDKGLRPNAKLLYGEITALSNKEGFCWASNKYFADLYQVSTQAISRWVNLLLKRGYISVRMEKDGKKIVKRIISIKGYQSDVDRVSTKSSEGYQQKVKENTTVINNTISVQFKEFWNIYSKKEGKQESLVIWNKLTDEDRKAILSSVAQFVLKHEDEQYRPLPKTFLRNRRWEDEITIKKNKTPNQPKYKTL